MRLGSDALEGIMEGKGKAWLHTFITVIICIAVYQTIVKPVLPSQLTSWVGI